MPKIVVRKPNEPVTVPMYSMLNGQIGRVVDISLYNGEIVFASIHPDSPEIRVVSLTTPGRFWTNTKGTKAGVEVEILPEGTVIEITV
jgi:hypothetical protein